MTFDMSRCKNGDKLRARNGRFKYYVGYSNRKKLHVVEGEKGGLSFLENNGKNILGRTSGWDIIGFVPPLPRIVKCEAWVNLYKREKGLVEIFSSKDAADNDAVPSRLECRHIEWSYEEEQ